VLLQGFYRRVWSVGMVPISTGVGDVPAGFGDAHATGATCSQCNRGDVAVRRALEPGPIQCDRGELSDLLLTRPRRPSAGRGG
jgi:hypothetical protein